MGQVQRLGRQILEALLFLRDRGISTHGHLHSGNVIIQNGVARYGLLISGIFCCYLRWVHKRNIRDESRLHATSVQKRLDRQ